MRAAPADTFFVDAFLIETATGVVVVDTQFLVSSSRGRGAGSRRLKPP
jgi:hypothetical protein